MKQQLETQNNKQQLETQNNETTARNTKQWNNS